MFEEISVSVVLNSYVMLQRKWIGIKMERSHSRSFYLRSRIGWALKMRQQKNKESWQLMMYFYVLLHHFSVGVEDSIGLYHSQFSPC